MKTNAKSVFVLNSDKKPLAPCNQAEARRLLANGKAAVWYKDPFTIILKEQASIAKANNSPIMDLKQLTKFLGISKQYAMQVMAMNLGFPVIKIGDRRYFSKKAVVDWINSQSTTVGEIRKSKQNKTI